MSKNNQLKLVSRSSESTGSFFVDPAPIYFGNHIKSIFDTVYLSLSRKELLHIADLTDWSVFETDTITMSFLEKIASSFTGEMIEAPYFEALLSVKQLTLTAI